MKNLLLKLSIFVVLLFSAVFSSGCMYMKDRALDFADIWTCKVGYGGPISVSAYPSGLFYGAAGISIQRNIGFIGRDMISEKATVYGVPFLNIGLPIVGLVKGFSGNKGAPLISSSMSVLSLVAIFSTGYETREDLSVWDTELGEDAKEKSGALLGLNLLGYYGLFQDEKVPPYTNKRFFDIKANLCLGFTLEFGFNLYELSDFLLGWTKIDIANDDFKPEKDKPKKGISHISRISPDTY